GFRCKTGADLEAAADDPESVFALGAGDRKRDLHVFRADDAWAGSGENRGGNSARGRVFERIFLAGFLDSPSGYLDWGAGEFEHDAGVDDDRSGAFDSAGDRGSAEYF